MAGRACPAAFPDRVWERENNLTLLTTRRKTGEDEAALVAVSSTWIMVKKGITGYKSQVAGRR
jgi:hypothetical protein